MTSTASSIPPPRAVCIPVGLVPPRRWADAPVAGPSPELQGGGGGGLPPRGAAAGARAPYRKGEDPRAISPPPLCDLPRLPSDAPAAPPPAAEHWGSVPTTASWFLPGAFASSYPSISAVPPSIPESTQKVPSLRPSAEVFIPVPSLPPAPRSFACIPDLEPPSTNNLNPNLGRMALPRVPKQPPRNRG